MTRQLDDSKNLEGREMGKELGLTNHNWLGALKMDQSITQAAKVLESIKIDSALTRSFKAMDAMKIGPAWARVNAAAEALKMDSGLARSMKALGIMKHDPAWARVNAAAEALKMDSGLARSMKAFDIMKHDPAWARVNATTEALKMDSGLARSMKALDIMKHDPAWARVNAAAEAFKIDSELARAMKAIETIKLDWTLMKSLEIAIPNELQMSRLQQIVNKWQNSNPLGEVGRVADTLTSEGLLDAVSNCSQTSTSHNSVSDVRRVSDRTPATNSAISVADVQAMIDRVVDRATDKATESLTPLVVAIADEMRAMNGSPLKQILLVYILPILFIALSSLISPIADYYIKGVLESRSHPTTPREVKKNVRKNVPLYADNANDLKPFRIVSRRELAVHSHPSSRSPAFADVYLGDAVVLLEKRKDWSWIAWSTDEDSPARQGWVFTRYVTKIV
ncbi:hypothetical protein SB861_33980 [Paraburkholderia sp. SIMBA_049]